MSDILAGLNPAQREAAEAIKGPVLILAGPGSGKTRVIVHRIAYLIKVAGISPHRILAVTFTNKAAREMTERLNQLVSGSVKDLTMGTFHSICARILRVDGKAIGVDPGFVIYDEEDQVNLVKKSLELLGLDPKQHTPKAIQTAINSAKSKLITPVEYGKHYHSYLDEIIQRVYERYQQLLTGSNALDFEDLLLRTVQLFKQHPDVLARYQLRYLHVHVDEFQDTNLVQYELVKQLAGKYRNICVVGDPDQSIYSWRHADLRNILNFEKDYPDAKVVLLEQNYRSTKMILDAASSVIAVNKERKQKNLWTENPEGLPINIVETYTEQEEAQFVVNEIDNLTREGYKLGDFAVMYRTNAQSRALEEAFIRYGTPYKLVAGTRFYERREVKDVIAYLRLVSNPDDSVSLLRIINCPARGIGQTTISAMSQWARSKNLSEFRALQTLADDGSIPFNSRTVRVLKSFGDMMAELAAKSREVDVVTLLDLVVERSGYQAFLMSQTDGEERWENILELRTVAQQYRDLPSPDGLTALLEAVTLISDVDTFDQAINAATLITLHQAKGLEFPVVFIVGMEDGILPHIRSFDDPQQMEEERRLCYVGITRAKERMYLVRAFRRSLMGASTVNRPSRFLKDIPPTLVAGGSLWAKGENDIAKAVYAWKEMPVATPRVDLPQLKAGDHVRHPQFGPGLVVSATPMKEDIELVVAFNGGGIKKLMQSFAKLDKV